MRSTGGRWLLLPPLALLLIGLIAPLVAVVAAGLADRPVNLVAGPFRSDLFLGAVGRTFWLSALVTVFTVVVGVVYAVALVAAPRWLAGLLFGVLFLTFWVSLLVRTFGWVLTLQPAGALDGLVGGDGLGLYQTTAGLVPAMVHIMLPYLVLPVYADLRALDAAQLRAARSLGGGEWLTLRSVVFPAIRPGVVAGAVIVFVLSLGFYVTPAFLGGPSGQVVSIVIGTQFGRLRDLGGAASMGVLLLVVTLGLYLLADRFLGIGRSWSAAVERE